MATTSSTPCHFTMASPLWLILYLLCPNCRMNSMGRSNGAHIAKRRFAMLKVLAKIAYQGHTATSVSGGRADETTLTTREDCAKVHANGDLDMDSKLTAWKDIWSHLEETQGHAVINVDAKPNFLWEDCYGYGSASSSSRPLASCRFQSTCGPSR